MRILTCVKYVPDPVDEVSFSSAHTLDRAASSCLLSELDEYAVEQALQARAALPEASVAALTVGPADAEAGLRKALQMGADEAYLVSDDAIAGSDVFGTVAVLAAAVRAVPDAGLVICGMSSTDGEMGVLPALLAHALDWPLLSMAASLEVAGSGLRGTRVDEVGARTVETPLPAVVSVTDQTGEPRYPTFKDVMAAKKKPVTEWSLADLGVDPATVGAGAARVEVATITRNPDRQAGTVLVDDGGSSVTELVAFLTEA
ncbi:electron transfer flavoprotein subunit beta/FixA family protein [Propionicicella superfundia]|uniref:electron transfer flavoprotein subunit beta/FixA family protein n=1 Tax=Propionicicella superfundia TaxID=348582 RepID=UPI000428D0EE|nr:electron transfer flavoprotein subunit beta/FixA family protein [Propionicicella superfundia]